MPTPRPSSCRVSRASMWSHSGAMCSMNSASATITLCTRPRPVLPDLMSAYCMVLLLQPPDQAVAGLAGDASGPGGGRWTTFASPAQVRLGGGAFAHVEADPAHVVGRRTCTTALGSGALHASAEAHQWSPRHADGTRGAVAVAGRPISFSARCGQQGAKRRGAPVTVTSRSNKTSPPPPLRPPPPYGVP